MVHFFEDLTLPKAKLRLRLFDQMRWRWHRLTDDEKTDVQAHCKQLDPRFPDHFRPTYTRTTLNDAKTWVDCAKKPLLARGAIYDPPKRIWAGQNE